MIAPKELLRPEFSDEQRDLRAELAVLRDRSIDAGDIEAAKLCRIALLVLDPCKPQRECVQFSGPQLWVIREAERVAREKLPSLGRRLIKRSTVISECKRLERESRARSSESLPQPAPTPLSEATGANDTATPVAYLEEHRLRRAGPEPSESPGAESNRAAGGQS